ncbi:MAG: glycosyltransferase [Flavobacterium sp.]|nr:glycosyltransferase [Flavobacterium sp.]
MSANVKVIDIEPNQGLANAVRTALRHANENMENDDIMVLMDADDSHTPFLINRMISQVLEGSDVVIASRYQKGSRVIGLSKMREYLSICAAMVFIITKNIKGVKDYTCGFRAYRMSIIKKAHEVYKDRLIEQQGFGCMAELLIKLNKIGAIFHEVPFILRYDFKLSDSKIKIGKTIKQTLKLIFR